MACVSGASDIFPRAFGHRVWPLVLAQVGVGRGVSAVARFADWIEARSHCAHRRCVVGNRSSRDFVHTQVGLPVSAIIVCYRASVAPGAEKPALPPQLEYNRHMQSYAREHPGASRAEVLSAWKARRARPAS